MKLARTGLKIKRHWRSATEMNESKFRQLLPYCAKSYKVLYGNDIVSHTSESPNSPSMLASGLVFRYLKSRIRMPRRLVKMADD